MALLLLHMGKETDMPKYILVHDETLKMAIMECSESEIMEIVTGKTGFHLLRSYQTTPIKK